jgi:hypothetical protein
MVLFLATQQRHMTALALRRCRSWPVLLDARCVVLRPAQGMTGGVRACGCHAHSVVGAAAMTTALPVAAAELLPSLHTPAP